MALTRSDSRNRTCLPTFTKAMRRLSTRRRIMRVFAKKPSKVGPLQTGRIPVNVATPSVLEGSCLEVVVVLAALVEHH